MTLIIRADASVEIGTGHIMRCLALAQAWQQTGGETIFVMGTSTPVLEKRLDSEQIKVICLSLTPGSCEDAKETALLALRHNASWVIVDGYHFGGEYQQVIKDFRLRLLFIDDFGHATHYYADIVLNQNIFAHEGLYTHREYYTNLLLGNQYILLRQEFQQWVGWQRSYRAKACKILITMGGADADNVTLKIIQALRLVKADELETVVVVGGSNPHYQQLCLASKELQFSLRIEKNVENMAELMTWADIAVSAGGSTCWELAFMGLPSLILVLAENQRENAEKLGEMEAIVNLGWHEDVSANQIASAIAQLILADETRMKISKRSQHLVDGKGSKRVLMHIDDKKLRLRLVQQEDCRLLWEWSNDPEVRAISFFSEAIPWEQHVEWFASKINSTACILYIAVDRNEIPVGQIRYDIETNQAIVSINIDNKFRHQGYGSHLIKIGCKKLFHDSDVKTINAYIKPSNQVSIRAFSKAGFQNMGTITLRGCQAIHLSMSQQNFD